MYSYVTVELPALIEKEFGCSSKLKAIFGHSMGGATVPIPVSPNNKKSARTGHGAITIALKNADAYTSVSAFAPICHPTNCPWGQKAFKHYLGSVEAGKDCDATLLIEAGKKAPSEILIDQGLADGFLDSSGVDQLQYAAFEAACKKNGQALRLRLQPGYECVVPC